MCSRQDVLPTSAVILLRNAGGLERGNRGETVIIEVVVEMDGIRTIMKTCSSCGDRVYREHPTNAEYGLAVVDGRRYPDACPGCGNSL